MANFYDRVTQLSIIDNLSGKTIVIDDLNIDFTVNKLPEGNTAVIKVFNCNKDTVGKILSATKKSVVLRAGYVDNVQTIYKGDIIHVENDNSAPDKVISLECNTGIVSNTESSISISFKENSSAKEILSKVVESFKGGVSVQKSLDSVKDVKLLSGFAHNGPTFEAMNKLADILGIVWTNQDNKIKIYKKGKGDNTKIVVLSPDTGLIGSPKAIKKDSGGGTGTAAAFELQSFLLPSLEIGGHVSVNSELVNVRDGVVVKLIHKGSIYGQTFSTTLQVEEVAS